MGVPPLSPRALARRRRGPAVGQNLDAALRGELDQACRSAARPRGGELPDGADAVLFAGPAELLACLALDLARGRLHARWWWRRLAPLAGRLALAPLLAEHARALPAALAIAEGWQGARQIAAALEPPAIATIVAALCREHGLATSIAGDPIWHDPPPAPPSPPEGPQPTATDAPAPEAAPVPWAPEAALAAGPALLPAAQALLGIALTVHQAPQRARSPLFAAEFQVWSAALRRQAPATTGRAVPSPARAAAGGERAPPVPAFELSPTQATGRGHEAPLSPDATAVLCDPAPAAPAGDSHADPPAPRPEPVEGPRLDPGAARPRQPPVAPAKPSQASDLPIVPSASPDIVPFEPSAGIETRLGGLLYLVNLMLHLDLPACFDGDWRIGGQLGPWALLELLGRALLGDARDEHAADPIWRVLAALDARAPGTLAGAGFTGAAAFRLPGAWAQVVATPDEGFLWRARRGRLAVWSDAGYVLAELPCCGDAARQAQAELGACRPGAQALPGEGAAPIADLADLAGGDLGRWLALVTPFLHRRLTLALGVDAAALHLLCRPARLFVTASHLDLVAALDDTSPAVRRSGLDRDPGWVPQLGRVILFHFR